MEIMMHNVECHLIKPEVPIQPIHVLITLINYFSGGDAAAS